MKCAKCGAELKVGCIYCSVCGQEAQIVPDYNLLEDDFLKSLLKEENQPKQEAEKKKPQPQPQPKPKKKKKKGILIAAVIVTVLLAVILTVILIKQKNSNSYDYQMQKAESCIQDKDYIKAQKYLEHAIEIEEESTKARLLLADVYLAREDKDDAIDILKDVLKIEENNEAAYKKLIEVYADLKDYEAIAKLASKVTDSRIMALFSEYQVTAPEADLKSGKYEELITVEVFSQQGTTTYYTIDGSEPRNGTIYKEPIALEEGKTTVRMISVNEFGIYSEETKEVYEIQFKAPDAPKVTPSDGSFNLPQQITVEVPEGCRAYFTWDGSDPTSASEQYTAPLVMPEGNNIFSVILVDEHNLCSEVTKCNFIYIP